MEFKIKRIVFLGAGFMAGAHAKALSKMADVEIVGVCAAGDPSAERFAETFSPPVQVYKDFKTMLNEARPHAVYICLPPFAHSGEVEEAARRGLGVFLEKPISLTIERARSMVVAVEKAGVTNQIGFQMRFHPAVQEMQRRIAAGEAGCPVLFVGRYWTCMDGSPWWRDSSKSGGQILEQVIHIYDLAAHLMGPAHLAKTVGHLANLTHQTDPSYQIEDLSVGLLFLSSGGVCTITGCNSARPMHFIADFRAVFANAMLDYRCSGQPWVIPDAATLTIGDGIAGEWSAAVDLIELEDRHFIDALDQGTSTNVPLNEGLRALEWVLAVKDAATKSRNIF